MNGHESNPGPGKQERGKHMESYQPAKPIDERGKK